MGEPAVSVESAGGAGPPSSPLAISRADFELIVTHCLRSYPDEGCGLLAGIASANEVRRCFAACNAAASARIYAVDPSDHLRADREAEAAGLELIGVFHSHTHTDPYPSPTDVAQAPDPSWHYVIVSFRDEVPSVRSYRIVDGGVTEEPLVVIS